MIGQQVSQLVPLQLSFYTIEGTVPHPTCPEIHASEYSCSWIGTKVRDIQTIEIPENPARVDKESRRN
jgi:hypothetical protein